MQNSCEADQPPSAAAITSSSATKPHGVELFIGNLSFFCEEKDLIDVIRSQSKVEVESVRICRSQRRGNSSLCYGFVLVKGSKQSHALMSCIEGLLFMGRKLRVEEVSSSTENHPERTVSQSIAIHVSFFSENAEASRINEVSLREIFEAYGEVEDVMIKRYNAKKTGTQGGYGFVYMQEESAAHSAIANIHQQVINTVQYSCQLSKHSSESQNNVTESEQI